MVKPLIASRSFRFLKLLCVSLYRMPISRKATVRDAIPAYILVDRMGPKHSSTESPANSEDLFYGKERSHLQRTISDELCRPGAHEEIKVVNGSISWGCST